MPLEKILKSVRDEISDSLLEVSEVGGEAVLHIKGESILPVLRILRDAEFNFLSDITAVDNLTLGGHERFAVVYHLLSHSKIERVVVKAYVAQDNPVIPSAESLWKTADWQEREVFDLYGIKFEEHPNLIRILNPDDYKDHPLRKDYPRVGRGERRDFRIVERRWGSKAE
ncbi:MAG: hypothetical protein CMF77_03975 [Candidatus Marinimicrobia bacterium]|nr:hypothetical protein [Candidatus Neomarinimicrobiota bacterium]